MLHMILSIFTIPVGFNNAVIWITKIEPCFNY